MRPDDGMGLFRESETFGQREPLPPIQGEAIRLKGYWHGLNRQTRGGGYRASFDGSAHAAAAIEPTDAASPSRRV